MSVKLILVTGNNGQLQQFRLEAQAANAIERRGQTVFYTVMEEDVEAVLTIGKETGVTVQQYVDEDPWWKIVVQGVAEAWKPKQK